MATVAPVTALAASVTRATAFPTAARYKSRDALKAGVSATAVPSVVVTASEASAGASATGTVSTTLTR